jgi:hypothetical protein
VQSYLGWILRPHRPDDASSDDAAGVTGAAPPETR